MHSDFGDVPEWGLAHWITLPMGMVLGLVPYQLDSPCLPFLAFLGSLER